MQDRRIDHHQQGVHFMLLLLTVLFVGGCGDSGSTSSDSTSTGATAISFTTSSLELGGIYSDIAVGSSNTLHLSYEDGNQQTNSILKYTTTTSGSFSDETGNSGTTAVRFSS